MVDEDALCCLWTIPNDCFGMRFCTGCAAIGQLIVPCDIVIFGLCQFAESDVYGMVYTVWFSFVMGEISNRIIVKVEIAFRN